MNFKYIIVFILLLSFSTSLYNIKYFSKKEKYTELSRTLFPIITMVTFFVACYFVSLIISDGAETGKDKYFGIIFMFIVGVILTVVNLTILGKEKLEEYTKGKKFSIVGLFMALGVSAIVFGFLDNFGMKLGTEALDDTFLQVFLSPFSQDTRFLDYQDNIKENLSTINKWVSADWRKVMNQLLRFKDTIKNVPELSTLYKSIKQFDCDKLTIPREILKDSSLTNDYVDNIRDKYDIIDGSKSMLGNTFSDFIGAILGAALINLFIYMTAYDGIITGDDKIDNNFFTRHLSSYAPFMEAIFIALGCLVPIFLNIAMNRNSNKKNNFYSWLVVGFVFIVMIIMMYISSKGVKNMDFDDKKNSIKKTLIGLKARVDLNKNNSELENVLEEKVDNFINSL